MSFLNFYLFPTHFFINPIYLKEKLGDFGESGLEDVQMNCNATFISVTLRNENNMVDPKLYIYEIEKDVLRYYNFAAGQNDSEDISVPPNSAQSHSIQTASMQVGFKCLISAKNTRSNMIKKNLWLVQKEIYF